MFWFHSGCRAFFSVSPLLRLDLRAAIPKEVLLRRMCFGLTLSADRSTDSQTKRDLGRRTRKGYIGKPVYIQSYPGFRKSAVKRFTTLLSATFLAVTFRMPFSSAVPIVFSNMDGITINESSSATPYPSTINVTGVGNAVGGSITASFDNLNHTFLSDVDALLVAPSGNTVFLMSDVGVEQQATNVDLVFQDGAPSLTNSAVSSGTFAPTNLFDEDEVGPEDAFGSPAPAGPYGTTISGLIGGNLDGTWSLFVVDDTGGDSGFLGGWGLEFNVTLVPEPSTSVSILGFAVAALALGLRKRRGCGNNR